ncbi:MAG: hypothetical protein ACRDEA_01720 [Microcystaceae cyanobacterium]
MTQEVQTNQGRSERSSVEIQPVAVTQANSSPVLVEAQGWIITPDGRVSLIAYAPTATPHNSGLPYLSCLGS